jgi:hypothetical protein
MIKIYDRVKIKNGKYAVIVDILEVGKAYMADIEISDDEYSTESISHSDIDFIISANDK